MVTEKTAENTRRDEQRKTPPVPCYRKRTAGTPVANKKPKAYIIIVYYRDRCIFVDETLSKSNDREHHASTSSIGTTSRREKYEIRADFTSPKYSNDGRNTSLNERTAKRARLKYRVLILQCNDTDALCWCVFTVDPAEARIRYKTLCPIPQRKPGKITFNNIIRRTFFLPSTLWKTGVLFLRPFRRVPGSFPINTPSPPLRRPPQSLLRFNDASWLHYTAIESSYTKW